LSKSNISKLPGPTPSSNNESKLDFGYATKSIIDNTFGRELSPLSDEDLNKSNIGGSGKMMTDEEKWKNFLECNRFVSISFQLKRRHNTDT
jgi:hypothetical protein